MTTLDVIEQELLARWPESSIDPTLERITMLLRLLGEPHRDFRCVHLTGTNGKTSTARMVESLLAAHGLRTGRFTSPHLASIRERICLDGTPIDTERFIRTYWGVAERAGRVDASCDHAVSFFEMTVAMAYQAFACHRVQAAVVEVGMGGRWDATNVVDADVAAILPVALDHTDYLGPTIEAIAAEKAGIIKPGAVVVSARQTGAVATILEDRAREVGATLVVEGRDFAVIRRSATGSGQLVSFRGLHGQYGDVVLPLHGEHQAQNAAVAIASAEAFLGRPVDLDLVRRALGRVTSPGRFEIRAGTPPVILDAAHNPHGAQALARNLAEHASGRTVAVLSVMGDKDYAAVLRELECVVDQVVCTRSSSPRSLSADGLAACARDVVGAGRVHIAADVASALATARALATADPVPVQGSRILVTGSVVTVADATRVLVSMPEQRHGWPERCRPIHG